SVGTKPLPPAPMPPRSVPPAPGRATPLPPPGYVVTGRPQKQGTSAGLMVAVIVAVVVVAVCIGAAIAILQNRTKDKQTGIGPMTAVVTVAAPQRGITIYGEGRQDR